MKYRVQRNDVVALSGFRLGVGVVTGPRGITDNVLAVVRHDADANVERPDDFQIVLWVGSVTPANAILGVDMWVDTA